MVWHRRLGHPNTQILSHVLNYSFLGHRERSSLSLVTPRFSVRPEWRIRTGFRARDYILGLIGLCTCTCGYTNNFCTNKNHLHIQKNYHRSDVHQNLYTYTESHLLIHVHLLLNIFCSSGIQNIIILLHWSLHLIQTLIHIHI